MIKWVNKLLQFPAAVGGYISQFVTKNDHNGSLSAYDQSFEPGGEPEIDSDKQAIDQFADEFNHRQQGSILDRIITYFNRVARIILTLSVFSVIFIAPFASEVSQKMADAFATLPAGYWALAGIVATFYFATIIKHEHDLRMAALTAAKQLVSMRKEFRRGVVNGGIDDTEEDRIFEAAKLANVDGYPKSNKVVKQWLVTREIQD